MGGDKAIGCHSHPQGNQELKISYKLFNPPRRQDKAIGCQSHDHQVPKVQLLIPLFNFEENLFTPGEETLRETPKLCCLLETQPDHDGVKDVLKFMMEVLKIMMIMVMKVWMLQR